MAPAHCAQLCFSVIVDTDGETCITASFVFGSEDITREYEIRVLQYSKQNELGGPPGCLQFFIDDQETVTTFNWDGGKLILNMQFLTVTIREKQTQ